ncbi:MAG TPA: alpha/beta hydrolase [Agriterribacter sp.]|nr:alpha/beta hydrolase [Agriterribacter sp.]
MLDSGGPSVKFGKTFEDNFNKRLTKSDLAEIARLDSLGLETMKASWPGYFYDRSRAIVTAQSLPDNIHGQQGVFKFTSYSYFDGSEMMIKNLRQTTVPVFLIQGREDPMGESTAAEIKEVLPQTVSHFIEKCGHLPWLENPPQVTAFFSLLRGALNK